MQKLLLALSLTLFTFALSAQTKTHKNNLTGGGGREQYNGDLGNSFFDRAEEWYGFFKLSYSQSLNPSIDIQSAATRRYWPLFRWPVKP